MYTKHSSQLNIRMSASYEEAEDTNGDSVVKVHILL
jgi:hypothetical protein